MPELDYSRHYRRFHSFSDEYYKVMDRSYQDFFRTMLPSDKSAPILDIGCGTGFAVHALREAGYINTIGIDADRNQVEIARASNLPVQHVSADCVAGFLSSLQHPPKLVLLMDVLEHIEKKNQIAFLQQIRSSLAPDGRLLCQVPNALSAISTYFRYVDWTHECLFTADSLNFVLESAGYSVEPLRPGHSMPSPPRGFISIAVPVLRSSLQAISNTWWRFVVLANLGFPRGWTHPIGPSLAAIATSKV